MRYTVLEPSTLTEGCEQPTDKTATHSKYVPAIHLRDI